MRDPAKAARGVAIKRHAFLLLDERLFMPISHAAKPTAPPIKAPVPSCVAHPTNKPALSTLASTAGLAPHD